MAHTRKMVVITESLYKQIMAERNQSSNQFTSLTENANSGNSGKEFDNLQRYNQNLDNLRRERESANVVNGVGSNVGNTSLDTTDPSQRPIFDQEEEKELFLEKIKRLAPKKSEYRILNLTNRILNEPSARLNRDILEIGNFSF